MASALPPLFDFPLTWNDNGASFLELLPPVANSSIVCAALPPLSSPSLVAPTQPAPLLPLHHHGLAVAAAQQTASAPLSAFGVATPVYSDAPMWSWGATTEFVAAPSSGDAATTEEESAALRPLPTADEVCRLQEWLKAVGRAKSDVSQWYLQFVEDAVDLFLAPSSRSSSTAPPRASAEAMLARADRAAVVDAVAAGAAMVDLGYLPTALPYEYIDEAPKDLEAVARNADVLAYLGSEAFHPSSTVRRLLIDPVVFYVWGVALGPLLDDMERGLRVLLACDGPGGEEGSTFFDTATTSPAAPIDWRARVQGCRDAGRCVDRNALLRNEVLRWPPTIAAALRSLWKDVVYLETILRMEDDFARGAAAEDEGRGGSPKKKEGLSDVVPISGLVLGKLHRLENEHRTALQHWTPVLK